MSTGIIYLIWGNSNTRHSIEINRSIQSVEKFGYKYHVFYMGDFGVNNPFALNIKSRMYDLSPFDNTLYLDTDTVLLDRVDFGFQMSEKHGLACCYDDACLAERWHPSLKDLPEYNTGVLFFKKNNNTRILFEKWIEYSTNKQLSWNDQAGFAKTISETNFNPFILPINYNYRGYHVVNNLFGGIKIWHSPTEISESQLSKIRSTNEWQFYRDYRGESAKKAEELIDGG